MPSKEPRTMLCSHLRDSTLERTVFEVAAHLRKRVGEGVNECQVRGLVKTSLSITSFDGIDRLARIAL